MPKFNDLDLKNWKEIDLNMDSLWMISERKFYMNTLIMLKQKNN